MPEPVVRAFGVQKRAAAKVCYTRWHKLSSVAVTLNAQNCTCQGIPWQLGHLKMFSIPVGEYGVRLP